jgi:hypothetical protein
MIYTYTCATHGDFQIQRRITDIVDVVYCSCGEVAERNFKADLVPVIYNAEGFSKDYFDRPQGRGQPQDKKEWLNKNWSKYYGVKPPPPDSRGTYDGR